MVESNRGTRKKRRTNKRHKKYRKHNTLMRTMRHIHTPSTKGKIDNVNDPDYNMRNIIKQSIMLEEHLAQCRKYCMGCIVKHFLHIIGLAEEGVWLAEADVAKYPLLEDSPQYYQTAFDMLMANRMNQANKFRVLNLLRKRRQLLTRIYYLQKKKEQKW